MNQDAIVREVHKLAGEFTASNGKTVNPELTGLLDRYGFTSLDALEFLLILEEQFEITFEDEDLSEEILSSETKLAEYIMKQRG